MSQFTVSGRFKDRAGYTDFETVIEAENQDLAREYVLSQLGSRHGVKRTQVELSEVQAR